MAKLGRRRFISTTAGGVAGAGLLGCKDGGTEMIVDAPRLRILRWQHFVTAYDAWFTQLAESWGEDNGVEVDIEFVDADSIVDILQDAIKDGDGPDLVETHSPAASLEMDMADLSDLAAELQSSFGPQDVLARASSQNPVTGKYYGITSAYTVWPANYLRSSWEAVGMPDGPTTYDELLTQGEAILQMREQVVGLGFSDEDNTNRSLRSILWAHGGRIQDENQNLALDSPETRAAMNYAKELFERTMDVSVEDIFNWDPGSNNDAIIGGTSAYILNPISAYRESQRPAADPSTALDMFFARPPAGPVESGRVMVSTFTQLVPSYSKHKSEAKDFIAHLVAAASFEVYNSELYNLPAYPSGAADLEGYLVNDPFFSDPPDKLQIFADASEWSANVGYPASSNAAIADVFNEFILEEMFRKYVRGELTEDMAIANAVSRIGPIFDDWRSRGFL